MEGGDAMITQWRRWDPRIEFKAPITEVQAFPQWIIEVVPDLFDPSNEALMQRVLKQIARYDVRDKGRFLLRTAHVERALLVLRRLREQGTGYRSIRIPNDAIILAVYAETQGQLEAGVKAMFAPRATPLDLVDSDPNEAIAMALREGVIFDWRMDEVNAALAKGADYLREYLRGRMSDMHCCKDIPVPTIAIYMSPRERMDLGAILQPMKDAHDAFMAKSNGGSYYYDENDKAVHQPRQFKWVVCAGRIGPFAKSFRGQGPRANDPHPMHHQWIADTLRTARAGGIPFCLPHLGEWAFTSDLSWNGDELVTSSSWSRTAQIENDDIAWEHVDYDPPSMTTPSDHRSSHAQAIGSHLTGRVIGGRVFDEWPSFKT
jgi:hypothetical protein